MILQYTLLLTCQVLPAGAEGCFRAISAISYNTGRVGPNGQPLPPIARLEPGLPTLFPYRQRRRPAGNAMSYSCTGAGAVVDTAKVKTLFILFS